MAEIIPLPTASPSFYTIRASGRGWAVDLVTPVEGGRPLRTTLARFADREGAYHYARDAAASVHRPFKIKGIVQ